MFNHQLPYPIVLAKATHQQCSKPEMSFRLKFNSGWSVGISHAWIMSRTTTRSMAPVQFQIDHHSSISSKNIYLKHAYCKISKHQYHLYSFISSIKTRIFFVTSPTKITISQRQFLTLSASHCGNFPRLTLPTARRGLEADSCEKWWHHGISEWNR